MITRDHLGPFARLHPPGEMPAIRTAAEMLGIVFPSPYLELILASDGLEIELEERAVAIYGSDELVERNETYETRKWLSNVLRIGDDGGGMGFHLDLSNGQIVAVGDGCPSMDDGWLVSPSLADWVQTRFAVDWSRCDGEPAELARVSLVKPLSVKELATLKNCLGLPESIVQLTKKCQELPVFLLETRLDIVRTAISGHPHLAAALSAKAPDCDVSYRLL